LDAPFTNRWQPASALLGTIPPRTTFYPLNVKAYNTPLVEGCTGYLRRLAAAHRVSVADLISHEHFRDLFPASADRRTRRRLFNARGYQLDGSESFGQQWIRRLETGTAQSNLRNTTLWPFVAATFSSWLRRRRAWCPRCLMDQVSASKELYDPLLWSIRIVTVCPVDLIPITEICPHCGRSALPFAGIPFPGICGRCGGKLWVAESPHKRLGWGDQDKYAIWSALEMLSVIGALSEFNVEIDGTSLANLLSAKVASVGNRNMSENISMAGCSKRSTYLWASGTVLPRVESIFRLCFHLGLHPADLLREAAGLKVETQEEVRPSGECLTRPATLRSSTTPSEQAVLPFLRGVQR
jgi:hypothetical protein